MVIAKQGMAGYQKHNKTMIPSGLMQCISLGDLILSRDSILRILMNLIARRDFN